MNFLLRFSILLSAIALPAGAANIAGSGTGLMGSNDATINDAGTSHAQAGTVANIRDGNLATRVDNFQASQPANVNGYVGISWATARTDVVKSLTLTMACFVDGGWFGNRESPRSGYPLTATMLVPPVVQVATTSGTWTTVPSTSDYLTAFTGHGIAENAEPTSRTFTITLPQWQTGMRFIRIIGPTGGWGDGNGFLGVFELEVNADAITDSDVDGMDDAWETANGLTVGTNDANLDADSDGLSNVREFRWQTNPQLADTDGDGLNDGPEDVTHGTFPNAPDTDGDGLSDGAEITTHLTSAKLTDTDGDGLSDAAEINTHLTLPLDKDTDDDGFSDGAEIALSTNPLNAASRSANIARGGRAIMGRNTTNSAANLAVTGTGRANANSTAHLNDGDLYTRADTAGMTGTASHLGILWDAVWPQPVKRLEITMAIFADGGWIGNANFNPQDGGPLTATHITGAPVLQTTTDGTAWTTVNAADFTTDYVTRLIGHGVGGGPRSIATRRAFVVTLNTPAGGIRGIRIAGLHRNFLGAFEIAACDTTTAADTDGDGLSNAAETIAGTSAAYSDTDEDTAADAAEVNTLLTNPLLADTDGDLFPDGLEVRQGTNPVLASSYPPSLSLLGGGIIGIQDVLNNLSGTPVANAGVPGNLTDGETVTRVDSFNNTAGFPYSFLGVRWPMPVNATAVQVQFATFNHAGWFGPAGIGPAAGGALTAAHLAAPIVQVTYDGGSSWNTVPATNDYVTQLTGHVIAAANNRPTRPPLVTFTLASAATGMNGLRLIGVEGGVTQPFVGAYEVAVVPTYAPLPTTVSPTWVAVGNPGNAADANGYGAVNYTFQISAHEVTIAQYAAFLNAVAASDPNGLYAPEMGTVLQTRGIFRSGASGAYQYHIVGDGSRPIAWVNWASAARFVNWLLNGQGSGGTETGAYNLTLPPQITVAQVRTPGTTLALPSTDEWYKAAYYDPAKNGGAGGYWLYATRAASLVNNSVSANYFDGDYAATQSPTQNSASNLLPVGYFSSVPSAYGTFDQTGSVAEWVEQDNAANRLLTGGSWLDNPAAGASLSAGTVEHRSPTERFNRTGFRVVSCPPAPALFESPAADGKTYALAADRSGGASVQPHPDFPTVGGPGLSPPLALDTESGTFGTGTTSLSFAELINSPITDGAGPGFVNCWARAAGAMGTVSVRAYSSKPRYTLGPGLANAGWSETFLVTAPGLQGQTGWLTFNVSVNGSLTASGANGAAAILVRAFLNGLSIPLPQPGASSGSGIYPGGEQLVRWSYRSDVPPPFAISSTITFSVPITFGQQFRVSLYSLASASSTSTSNFTDIVTGYADAEVKWEGINSVLNSAQTPVTGYTVDSQSGSATLPPTDIALSASSLQENNVPGATIGTLSATDPNPGDTHTFTLVSGAGDADNAAFTITGTVLSINGNADFENKSAYSIRVRATDNGAPPSSYEEVLAVTVTDMKDYDLAKSPGTAADAPGVVAYGADGFAGSAMLAADINGDHMDDLIMGAESADAATPVRADAGAVYVWLGQGALAGTKDAKGLAGTPPDFTILGASTADYLTFGSTLTVADVNGDGFNDLLLGTANGDGPAESRTTAGEAYIVFGRAVFPAVLDLAVQGAGGADVTIYGGAAGDELTRGGLTSGDVNGDGIADVLLGAPFADVPGRNSVGKACIVFGRAIFPSTFDLSLTGASGASVTIHGAVAGDLLTHEDSLTTGDVNGDGTADIILGASNADGPNNTRLLAGAAYIIFGRKEPFAFPGVIDLATADSAAVTIHGASLGDMLTNGGTLTADVNGDGVSDLILHSLNGDGPAESRDSAGEVYVVLGRRGASAFPAVLDLAMPGPGGADVTIYGGSAGDLFGGWAKAVADLNGDGVMDILLGSPLADGPGDSRAIAGEACIIFGRQSPAIFPATIDLALPGGAGGADVTIFGAAAGDELTGSGSLAAGDVNGDGITDLILGAQFGDGPGNTRESTGDKHVVFGRKSPALFPAMLDLAVTGSPDVTIFGGSEGDSASSLASRYMIAPGDLNGDGVTDFSFGARYADGPGESRSSAGEGYVIFGQAAGAGAPELTITQPVGAGESPVVDNGAARNYGELEVGGIKSFLFKVRNTGSATLNFTGAPVTSGGADASQFIVVSQPPATLAPGASSGFLVRFFPTGPGLKTATLSIPSNDADEGAFTIVLTGTGICPSFPVWQNYHFAGGAANPNAAASADPDQDGADNLLEFAFNLNPGLADAATLAPGGSAGLPRYGVEEISGEPHLTVEFIRHPSTSTYTLETSTGLQVWDQPVPIIIGAPVPVPGGFERVKWADPEPLSAFPRRYLRVHVIM